MDFMKMIFIIFLITISTSSALQCWECNTDEDEGCGLEIFTPSSNPVYCAGNSCVKMIVVSEESSVKQYQAVRGCNEFGDNICNVMESVALIHGSKTESCEICHYDMCNNSKHVSPAVIIIAVAAFFVVIYL